MEPQCEAAYTMLSEAHRNCICANKVFLGGTPNVTIVEQYDSLFTHLVQFAVLRDDNMAKDSCKPANVALYWLAQDIVENDTPEETWANRFLLASLFLSWTGDNPFRWKAFTGWMSDEDVCIWFGVTCNMSSREVEQLKLSNNELLPGGGLPDALFELKSLIHIDLSFNDLAVSSIPIGIQKLKELQFLNLEVNIVSGPLRFEVFPTSLGEWCSLF
jgi:hypothetical protein